MKSLILAITVALFATLLNLGDAGTNAGTKVVASYEGFDKRSFSDVPTIACIATRGWKNLDTVENVLQNLASGNNDMKKTVPLDKAGFILYSKSSENLHYCKFVVPGGYEGPKFKAMNGKVAFMVYKPPHYAFYAKKAADMRTETIMATAAEVLAAIAALNKPSIRVEKDSIMVEFTATNEIYVGPRATLKKKKN